ncbi:methyltransferase family protein [Solirubrobacter pauli]|uniref:Methyltransferase family protein n=1 Tax=Solirubrobacter pauli TaxID=166793 RepID=A0A660KZI0_9ACTN|nr:methyltransferase [Solirubrobacter pauli]RKQ86344.1 methyltransferase family protein [Solirubrobacter pauli]
MAYVHGYAARESERLNDQAGALVELLHHDTVYPAGSRVLEAGCGVGAQTITLAANSPDAQFTSIELSPDSLAVAQERVTAPNVTFEQADLFTYEAEPFDHVFVCFVLEHLRDPYAALRRLRGLLKPGGTITVIEGDHGSTYFHPESAAADDAIDCLVKLQSGDAKIGRRLYPLLVEAGFPDTRVSPRMVYVDASKPDLVDGFTLKTFTAMIEGVREAALTAGLIDADRFDQGISDLAATETFSYTFFKAVATRG